MKVFIERLRGLLQDKDMKQKEIARRIGVTEVTISRYLSGDRLPRIDVVVKLADELGVSTDYLLGETDFKYYEDEEIDNMSMFLEAVVNSNNDEIKVLSRDLLELFFLTNYDSIYGNRLTELNFLKKFYYIVYKLQNTLSNNAFKKFVGNNSEFEELNKVLSNEDISEIVSDLKLDFNTLVNDFVKYYTNKKTWLKDLDSNFKSKNKYNINIDTENMTGINNTVGTHSTKEEFTSEELKSIEVFKKMVINERSSK